MKTIKQQARRFGRYIRNTRAVSAMEYAILVGVIAVAVGGALTIFGDQVSEAVDKVGKNVIATHADKGTSTSPSPSPSP